MSNKKPKYFPNNWKAYKDSPDEFFLPITYRDFFNWKVMGWALPSSIACVIREETDGYISEKVYSQPAAAQKYLDAKTADKNMKTIFTIVDGNSVQVLRPTRKGDKYKQLSDHPEDLDVLDDLTDEEIDELFG
tara:strand:+ start:82 stop:480 length:399 start_codon:yes stop_codon:yes gene_type:complete